MQDNLSCSKFVFLECETNLDGLNGLFFMSDKFRWYEFVSLVSRTNLEGLNLSLWDVDNKQEFAAKQQ